MRGSLPKTEVNLRVLDQDIALGSAGGRLMLNLLASFAEMEVRSTI
jgi:DNA invertase Pin-like site-specific DNA recombinase